MTIHVRDSRFVILLDERGLRVLCTECNDGWLLKNDAAQTSSDFIMMFVATLSDISTSHVCDVEPALTVLDGGKRG